MEGEGDGGSSSFYFAFPFSSVKESILLMSCVWLLKLYSLICILS